jgi:Integrase zinc binding domain
LQFNLVIRFCPGKLGTKPDALTRRWDIYLKEGGNDYGQVNPQNFRRIFTNQQLSESLRATSLLDPVLQVSTIMDSEKLHADILAHLASDPVAQKPLGDTSDPRWTQTDNGFLCHDDRIYVPESENLRLRVLQYKHDHVLSGHFGQNKTLALIRENTLGLDFGLSSSSFASHARLVCGLNHSVTGLTVFFSSSRSPNRRGIQYLWISLSSYRDLRDTLLYLW